MDNKENIKSKYLKRTNVLSKNFNDINEYQIEKIVEFTMCTNLLVNFDEVLSWWEVKQKQFSTSIKEIPLDKMKNWNVNSSKISHTSGKFFEILGLRIGEDTGREVSTGWDQPIVKENNFDGGILGLIRSYIEGLPHYLVQTRFEPGNYGPIQISPTLQATFSNLNQEHGGRKPHYTEIFEDYILDSNEYKFNAWLSEDGGKFYKKRNRGLVKQVKFDEVSLVDDNFMWLSLYQIKKLMNYDSIINPHLARLIFL
tara:strand:- start:355 stop:1119 length:765 start_codon:yes stop_codon:yes gene_type:complete